MRQTPVVQLQNATKKIGRNTVVDGLTFDIPAGEIFGFLGPNGAGKTTTIRMMVGLCRITGGDILIQGHSITKSFKKAIRHVGAIVENPDLYPYLTGYQNLKHFARMVPGVSHSRILEIAEAVGLQQRIGDKVKTYSLGMRQRLGIAQALLHRPSLLILDEPTNGLDPAGIHELRADLKRLAHEEGVAVFVSSHLLGEMELMCDRVGVLQHGRLVRLQSMKELLHKSGTAQVYISVAPSQTVQAHELVSARGKSVVQSDEQPGLLVIQMNKEDIPDLNKYLLEGGIQVYSIRLQERTLEDQFLKLTEVEK